MWFDADGGLEHGDEWDAKIRKQIKECVLFIPLISANTQSRLEGYFRIEWELAAQRALGIAAGVPFILPVVIDDTRFANLVERGRNVLTKVHLGANELLQMAGRVHGRVAGGRVFILSDRDIAFSQLRPTEPEFQLAGDSQRVALT